MPQSSLLKIEDFDNRVAIGGWSARELKEDKMLRIYYAHPMSWYGTAQEAEDVAELAKHGVVTNPNCEMFQQAVEMAKLRGQPVMQVFADFIKDNCDVVCFRRFNDGYIGAGVAREIFEAAIWNKTIWEIDRGNGLPPHVSTDMNEYNVGLYHVLSVKETKRRIMEKQL